MNNIIDTSKMLPPFEYLFNADVMKKMILRTEALELAKKIGEGENLNIFIGSSGAGRDTILEECFNQLNNAVRLKRTTTRSPREYITDQDRMLFITEEEFLQDFKTGEILFAGRYKANDRLYGISRSEILKLKYKRDNIFLLEENFSGLPLKVLFPKSKLIVILPPSLDVLEDRIFCRGGIKDECQKRLEVSILEIRTVLKNLESMIESGFVDMVIINDGLIFEVSSRVVKVIKEKINYFEDFSKPSESFK